MSRADRLRAFCERLAGEAVAWSKNDCSAAPALWVKEETGIVLSLPRYASRDEAHAVIEREGSLEAVWSRVCIEGGLSEQIFEPVLGDIAIIETRKYGQIGGIVADGRILLIRQDDGNWHLFGPVRSFVKVWAID